MIINNSNQISNSNKTVPNPQPQPETTNVEKVSEIGTVPVDASLLKAYIGVQAEKTISKQELFGYFDSIGFINQSKYDEVYESLCDKNGVITERAFNFLKRFQEKKYPFLLSVKLFKAAKEEGKINYKALFLADSIMDKNPRNNYFSGRDYCYDVLQNTKDENGFFNDIVLKFITQNSEELKPYMQRDTRFVFSPIKNKEGKLDLKAIDYADKKLSEGVPFSEVTKQIYNLKDKNGNLSYDVKFINDRLSGHFDNYLTKAVKDIALTFPQDKFNERNDFIDLMISMKDDRNLQETLNFIKNTKSDKNDKSGLEYNKQSISFVKDISESSYLGKDKLKIILSKLNLPYTKLSAHDIASLKTLCQSVNTEDIETFIDASVWKTGDKKGQFSVENLEKYLDIYQKNRQFMNINDINFLAGCFSLEEDDKALSLFQKLHTLRWGKASKYGFDEMLNKNTLNFILQLLCLEKNGKATRPCYSKVIENINKLFSMELPMSSKDAFENFIMYQDINTIKKLEKVNFQELGLKTGQISQGIFQYATEDELLHFKEYLKEYLKDKKVEDVDINLNTNISSIVEITTGSDRDKTKLLYDIKNGVPTAEIKEYKWDKRITRQEHDFKNNTVSEQKMKIVKENYSEYEILESQSLKKMDKNNNLIFEETIEKSPIDGVFNITRRNADGSKDIICNASKDSTGNEIIEKNMESLDGTKTYYRYESDPSGNRILDYHITDKNDKPILKQSLTFEVKDENHFVSSRNNKKFDIKLVDNNLIVKDLQTTKTAVLELQNFTKNTYPLLVKVLKQFPGDELFKMKELNLKAFYLNNKASNAAYNPKDEEIFMNENYIDTGVLLHEWGHGKDSLMFKEINETIKDDKKLREIYNQEKQAFRNYFGDSQLSEIGYFMSDYHYLGNDSIKEGIAETNTLLSVYPKDKSQAIRSHYWQQYFPKTIAYLATLLN